MAVGPPQAGNFEDFRIQSRSPTANLTFPSNEKPCFCIPNPQNFPPAAGCFCFKVFKLQNHESIKDLRCNVTSNNPTVMKTTQTTFSSACQTPHRSHRLGKYYCIVVTTGTSHACMSSNHDSVRNISQAIYVVIIMVSS